MVQNVDGRVCSLLWVFHVSRTFVSFSAPIMVVSPLSVDLLPRLCTYVICCTAAVIHGGWVDRFVGVTVVLRSAVLLSVGG